MNVSSESSPANGTVARRLMPFRITLPPLGSILRETSASQRGVALLVVLILFVLGYVVALSALSSRSESTPQAPLVYRFIDDSASAKGGASFEYSGPWTHVKGLFDGRSGGTSTRSLRVGAMATLDFVGRSVRVYGVTGPHGGQALLTLDGRTYGTISFFNRAKKTDVLVYSSPTLAAGGHRLSLIVSPPAVNAATVGYVNIDGADFAP